MILSFCGIFPTDRTSSVQTFDSLEFARYSDDGERQVDDRVAGKSLFTICYHLLSYEHYLFSNRSMNTVLYIAIFCVLLLNCAVAFWKTNST